MKLLLLVLLVQFAKGQISVDGNCPVVPPVENFRANDIVGRWYVISSFSNRPDGSLKCMHADLNLSGSEHIILNFTAINDKDNKAVTFEARQSYTDNIRKFATEIFRDRGNAHIQLTIISTNYDDYLVFWNCVQDGANNKQLSYLWGRRQTLSPELYADALNVYSRYNLPANRLSRMRQGCY